MAQDTNTNNNNDEQKKAGKTNRTGNPELDELLQDPADQTDGEDADGQGPDIPEDADVSHTKAYRGVLAELQAERARRQAAEEARGRTRDSDDAGAGKGKGDDDPLSTLAELDDDELPTVGQLRQVVQGERQRLQKREQAQAQRRAKERAERSMRELRTEYSPDKVGKDLAFDRVMQIANDVLDEDDLAVVQRSKNPARTAYRLAIEASPDLQRAQERRQRQRWEAERGSDDRGRRRGRAPRGDSFEDVLDRTGVSNLSDSDLQRAIAAANERTGLDDTFEEDFG